MTKFLNPQQSYTFNEIFELQPELDRLVNELGYTLQRVPLALPVCPRALDRPDNLRQRLEEILPYGNDRL